MRYVIIPILIFAIVYWIYSAVKDLITIYKSDLLDVDDMKESTLVFVGGTFMATMVFILYWVIYFCIEYW